MSGKDEEPQQDGIEPKADPSAPPPPSNDGGGSRGGQNGGDHHQERPHKPSWFPKRIRPAEWLMILITTVGAIATGINAWVAHGQLKAMQAQLAEMKGSSEQSERLIDLQADLNGAAGFQGAVTDRLSRNAKDQADYTKRLADIGGEQLRAAQISADAAIRAADAAQKTVGSGVLVQRAHITITNVTAQIIYGKNKDPLGIQITWQADNAGMSPGFIHKVPLNIQIGNYSPAPPVYPIVETHHTYYVGPRRGITNYGAPYISSFAALDLEGRPVYIMGNTQYTDIFGKPHTSGFLFKVIFDRNGASHSDILPDAAYWTYD